MPDAIDDADVPPGAETAKGARIWRSGSISDQATRQT
jgi:hypothetical protein